ncbi:MAG: FG-GAP repeat protein, partial [Gammaproteobacteria bacterium]
TLAVGVVGQDSNAIGINGDQLDDSAPNSGAVYVFTRTGNAWGQQAYIKASNTGERDSFGGAVSISGDGSTLAVGAREEDSNATGINGNQLDNAAKDSGAVYVFSRVGATWRQQAYIKASNTDGAVAAEQLGDLFGETVSLSADGNALAVAAFREDSSATGINGDQLDNTATEAGAVYVFSRLGGIWSQQAYLKASNTDANDQFGYRISLAGDGNTLAVAAVGEDGSAIGIGGNQTDNSAPFAGAVYVFGHVVGTWSQKAYIKARNTEAGDYFGWGVSLTADGSTLAVGAFYEDSSATGINGDQLDNTAVLAGAAYLY